MKAKPTREAPFTLAQRIAIAENMRLIALLAESEKIPEAKALAVLALLRIRSIGECALVEPATEEDARLMVEFARQNTREVV